MSDSIRDATGKFLPGHPGGPGSPHAHAIHRIRRAILACVTDEQAQAVWSELVGLCHTGPVKDRREAIVVYLDRVLGKPRESIEVDLTATSRPMADPDQYTDEQLAQVLAILEPPGRSVKVEVLPDKARDRHAITAIDADVDML